MDTISNRRYPTVVIMSASQVGKSEILNNTIGYFAHHEPCPILMVQPTVDRARRYSKERIAPMLRDTPVLKGLVKDPKSRDSGNTTTQKDFPGGYLALEGANAPTGLSSRSVRVCLLDEVDRFPASAGTEGDPVTLAEERTSNFYNAVIVLTSTPGDAGVSRIEAAFEESDQRHYWVPCLRCGEFQTLTWAQVRWDKDGKKHLTRTARYECVKCEGQMHEQNKYEMLVRGEWRADNPDSQTAGFHLSRLYSVWRKWSQIADRFLQAKGNPERLKAWTNLNLGLPFESQGEQADSSALYCRREHYNAECPDGVLCITAGVDVQDDRLEMFVWGWGLGEECWLLDHVQRWGNPARLTLWKQLALDFLKTYNGIEISNVATYGLPLALAGVDTGGHYTQQAYTFCKANSRAFALKGMDGQGRAVLTRPTKSNAGKVPLSTVGVDTCKELLVSRLSILEPGPGYVHLPVADWCDEELCDQLTAEKAVTRYKNGQPVRVWIKTRPRNEASDCWNYGYAAFVKLRPNLKLLAKQREPVETAPTPSIAKQVQVERVAARRAAARRALAQHRARNRQRA